MPNWCAGNIRLRGKRAAIVEFLRDGLSVTGHLPGSFDVVEHPVEITEFYGEYTVKDPTEKEMLFAAMYIKGTRRNFIRSKQFEVCLDDDEEKIQTVCIDDFEAAWAVLPEPYVEISRKYGLDIHIFGFERGMEFMQEVEVEDGELVRNEETTYDDWVWDCPMPNMGG